jgi:hypothetical protein
MVNPQQLRIPAAALFLLVSLCLSVRGQAESPARRNADEPANGIITGKVVNENGQPLSGASVFMRSANVTTMGRTTSTDAEGNFRVGGLEPALYHFIAMAPAYTSISSDLTAPTYYRIGDSLQLEMVRGGAITGTVTNGVGEPVISVRVRATMIRDGRGQKPQIQSPSFNEQSTDDRGVYRIWGLAPGTYLVSAGGSTFFQGFQFNPYDSDSPTYAPSSTRDNAAEVSVRGGEDTNVDIRYRGEPGYMISGTVKTEGMNGPTINLIPAGLTHVPVAITFQMPGSRGFAFNGISDGTYDLVAQEIARTQSIVPPQVAFSEPKRVTVKGGNVTGIELSMKPLASLSGRILLETSKIQECQGKRAPLFAETLVKLQRPEKESEKDTSAYLRMFSSSASPDKEGTFLLRNLLPGRYQFEPRFYARYWYLRSITMGAAAATGAKSQPTNTKTNAAANWTVVKPGEQPPTLTITLAEGAASIRGKLTVAEGAVIQAGSLLYLVPSEPDKAEDVLRFFVTEIGADGTFALNSLPPGKYWSLAQTTNEDQIATLPKLRQPESAAARTKLRRHAETQKSEVELKPCQNVSDYQLSLKN